MQAEVLSVLAAMRRDQLDFGTTGNVSGLAADRSVYWITPSGLAFDRLSAEDLVAIEVATGQVAAGHRRPSTESPLHRAIYQARPDVTAVVHTHPPFATVFAVVSRPIPALHYQMALAGDTIPVAPYATYGTEQLAENAVAALGGGQAVLLQNHGLVTVGASLEEAYRHTRDVEWAARLYYRALQVGEPRILTAGELADVREQLSRYGQPDPTR